MAGLINVLKWPMSEHERFGYGFPNRFAGAILPCGRRCRRAEVSVERVMAQGEWAMDGSTRSSDRAGVYPAGTPKLGRHRP